MSNPVGVPDSPPSRCGKPMTGAEHTAMFARNLVASTD